MNETDTASPLPPDWTLKRALELTNDTRKVLDSIKIRPETWTKTITIARMVEKCEKPPVDPVLKVVRAVASLALDEMGYTGAARGFLQGDLDYAANTVVEYLHPFLKDNISV